MILSAVLGSGLGAGVWKSFAYVGTISTPAWVGLAWGASALCLISVSVYLKTRFVAEGPQANIAFTPPILALLASTALISVGFLLLFGLFSEVKPEMLMLWPFILMLLSPLCIGKFDVIRRMGSNNEERVAEKWDRVIIRLNELEQACLRLDPHVHEELAEAKLLVKQASLHGTEKAAVMDCLQQIRVLRGFVDVALSTLPKVLAKQGAQVQSDPAEATRMSMRTKIKELTRFLLEVLSSQEIEASLRKGENCDDE